MSSRWDGWLAYWEISTGYLNNGYERKIYFWKLWNKFTNSNVLHLVVFKTTTLRFKNVVKYA